jgi:hypothetical protein
MKKLLVWLFVSVLFVSFAQAKEISGVNMPDQYQVGKTVLVLNGAGVRRKFIFVKVYVGGLYLQKKTSNPKDVLKQDLKVIRMHFTYSHVSAEKIRNAFKDDLQRVAPDVLNSEVGKKFLSLFTFNIKGGDNVDLIFNKDTLSVYYNLKKIGSIKSKKLVDAVVNIYIGDKPAQKSLKEGLLGK